VAVRFDQVIRPAAEGITGSEIQVDGRGRTAVPVNKTDDRKHDARAGAAGEGRVRGVIDAEAAGAVVVPVSDPRIRGQKMHPGEDVEVGSNEAARRLETKEHVPGQDGVGRPDVDEHVGIEDPRPILPGIEAVDSKAQRCSEENRTARGPEGKLERAAPDRPSEDVMESALRKGGIEGQSELEFGRRGSGRGGEDER